MKENAIWFDDGIKSLRAIRARKFNFIGKSKRQSGFFAHEVQAGGVGEAVVGAKDETDDQGNPVYQFLDYLAMLPTLWSAVRNIDERLREMERKR